MKMKKNASLMHRGMNDGDGDDDDDDAYSASKEEEFLSVDF